MPQCAVVGCNSTHRRTKGGSIKYHRFPGDSNTRNQWLQACGKTLNNCSTARICSRHFSASSYERDVQHELLGLPTRCRLKRGAVPDQNLPTDFLKEEKQPESAIAILLAVGLVPAKDTKTSGGGLPQEPREYNDGLQILNKMQIMENVREGCNANQPSSPGHAEQRQADGFDDAESKEETVKKEDPSENGVGTKEFADGDSVTVKEEKEDKELKVEDKQEENSNSSTENNKRKLDNEELAIKKLKTDIQENFHSRDKIINEFCELSECNTPEQIQAVSEHLLAEIKTLSELAKEKEREWNQILHTRKLKEELLIRLQRKKNTLFIGDTDINDLQPEVNGQLSVLKCNQKPNSVKTVNVERSKQKNLLHTTKQSQFDLNSALDFRQKQRPTRDVQAIIADHRQRHPEAVPRRGGSFASGQKPADHESASELGFLLNNMNGSRENSRSSTLDSYSQDTTSYQDILVQFAKLSQKEKNELQMHLQNNAKPPPPYPEVTVHPVNNTSSITPSNSLLHGILTKTPVKTSTNTSTNQNSKTSFSPTLARLLTAPERASSQVTSTPIPMGNTQSPGNMSLSDIIGSKARNEITITPVGNNQYESGSKADSPEDDSEEHPDRLIIDETTENSNSRQKDDNNSENGDDIPQCQGCNQKPAQFVCAGCGNQWYCSKDCQVSAWDEHSEVCSG
ncbi:hypothetical protein GWI33_008956 [Rhynchophorus ferrugineus]|uniref:Uncharacterized protein n=1 Tax=Rhynchophorus ferrugineus TaxID=354439 RepID=A0A834IQ79_RHYFE|nr:hypothetical protein GWI33_008956 [Rhynchophorus ferrugineus]